MFDLRGETGGNCRLAACFVFFYIFCLLRRRRRLFSAVIVFLFAHRFLPCPLFASRWENPPVDELLGYLKQHYEAFRSMPLFRNTTFLYVVENNMGNEHQWIARFVAETDTMANVYVLQERTGQVGFRTDEAAKLRRPRLLYDILQIDGMAIVKDVVSVNADKKRCGENAVDVFLLQMKRMQEFTRMTPNKVHTIISAIFNEEGKRIVENNDDVVQANIVMNEAMKLFLSKKLPTDQYTRINHIREHERGKRHKRQKMLPEGYGRALSVYGGDHFLNQ